MRGRDPKVERLAALPQFAGLGRQDLHTVARFVDEARVGAGAHLLRAGSQPRQGFVVRSGRLAVHRPDGGLTLIGPGCGAGLESVADDTVHRFDLTALTACDLLVFTPRTLAAVVDAVPALGAALLARSDPGTRVVAATRRRDRTA